MGNGSSGPLRGKRLIFDDPLKLLLAGEAAQMWGYLRELSDASVGIGVERAIKLLAMTVNPYYPKYRYRKTDYEEAYVDKDELLKTVGDSVKIPCYDVLKQGGAEIFQMIKDWKK